ncbi:MAG TPA: sugar-binding protein [Atribacteraceae bacterium]|nr:sugar-binding protein [Atribacteraceae bacterium]
MKRHSKFFSLFVMALFIVAALGGSALADSNLHFAFVTNVVADFWSIAQVGVSHAERDFGVTAELHMPFDGSAAEQIRILESMVAKQVDGIAVSAVDPTHMVDFLNGVAEQTILITHDSDAPLSNRIAYIGTNNYKAGRRAGQVIQEILPDGGEIMIFVGKLDVQNAIERRQGIIDELRGEPDDKRFTESDPIGEVIAGNITILDTLTDNVDMARAKQNVEDTLIRYPDVDCLVGLWSYNGPMMISAVGDAGLLGQIPMVTFDEEIEVLHALQAGYVNATIVQDPYNFGYMSIKLMAQIARGENPDIPEDGIIDVPARVITPENVDAFWADLREKLGQE